MQTACQAAVEALIADPCADVDCGDGGACSFGECSRDDSYSGDHCEVKDLCYRQRELRRGSGAGLLQAGRRDVHVRPRVLRRLL